MHTGVGTTVGYDVDRSSQQRRNSFFNMGLNCIGFVLFVFGLDLPTMKWCAVVGNEKCKTIPGVGGGDGCPRGFKGRQSGETG